MSQASTGLSRHERSGGAVRDPYFGTADAAAYVNYSESHFRALVRAGKVPRPLRIGGKLLWRQSLLDAHMHALAVEQGVIPSTAI
jgi:predicted DNA-binding transcriptional regulator AlpA